MPYQPVLLTLRQLLSRLLGFDSGFFSFLFKHLKLMALCCLGSCLFHKSCLSMEISIGLYKAVLYPCTALMLSVLAKCPCFLTLRSILGIFFIFVLMSFKEFLIDLSALFFCLRNRICRRSIKHLLCFAYSLTFYGTALTSSISGSRRTRPCFLKITGIGFRIKSLGFCSGYIRYFLPCRIILFLRHPHHLPCQQYVPLPPVDECS